MSLALKADVTSTNFQGEDSRTQPNVRFMQDLFVQVESGADFTTDEQVIRSAKREWQRSAIGNSEQTNPFRSNKKPVASFIAEQEWEGEVVEIGKDSFIAHLYDLTNQTPSHIQEESEFDLREISESDLPLVKEGAIFRWSLGFSRSISGTKEKTSRLVFRRLPAWTRNDIRDSHSEAEELLKSIEWDDD